MRRLLRFLLPLILLASCGLISPAPPQVQIAPKYVWTAILPNPADPTEIETGTVFCSPGQSSKMITAGHVIGPGITLLDENKAEHTVKGSWKHDGNPDVGVVFLDDGDKACENSPFRWAKSSGEVGSDAWLVGHPGALPAITRRGTLASRIEGLFGRGSVRIASLHAMGGDSGAPVFNQAGEIIGLIIGGTNNDVLDVVVPVEEIRKVVK